MLFRILILLLTVDTIISRLTCYHGEGYYGKNNISMKVVDCPSQKCILFKTYCSGYFSTTCYDDNQPLSVIKTFKTAQKLYKTQYWEMYYCGKHSECYYQGLEYLSNFMGSSWKSYDEKLWPKLKLPQLKTQVKNYKDFPVRSSYTFHKDQKIHTTYTEDVGFMFTGKLSAKKNAEAWMTVEYYEWRKPITFKVSNAKKVAKGVKKLIPGETIEITEKTDGDYINFYVNGVSSEKAYLPPGSYINVLYGGDWDDVQVTIKNTTTDQIFDSANETDFEPGFRYQKRNQNVADVRNFFPDKSLTIKSVEDYRDIQNNTSIYEIDLILLEPLEKMVVEFRDSLLPYADIYNLVIRVLRNESDGSYYFRTSQSFRSSQQWDTNYYFPEKPFRTCSQLYIKVTRNFSKFHRTESVYCDEEVLWEYTFTMSNEWSAKYVVFSKEKLSACV